jgi:hypothetical protein
VACPDSAEPATASIATVPMTTSLPFIVSPHVVPCPGSGRCSSLPDSIGILL